MCGKYGLNEMIFTNIKEQPPWSCVFIAFELMVKGANKHCNALNSLFCRRMEDRAETSLTEDARL
jgi:hypothetical protein